MAQPYVGEIRIFAGTYAPYGWLFCEGQHLAISDHETLYQLIGTRYGGDGQETFALPDLRGRLPMHQGNGFIPGNTGGVEEVTLTTQQIPAHVHPLTAIDSQPGTQASPAGNLPAMSLSVTPYVHETPGTPLSPTAVGATGGSQPHSNMQPYLCVNHIISLFGIFPSQT